MDKISITGPIHLTEKARMHASGSVRVTRVVENGYKWVIRMVEIKTSKPISDRYVDLLLFFPVFGRLGLI